MGFNYYAVLGISRSASDYDIKMAFRKKVIHYNPERNNDPLFKPMFTLICEAYEVLSDKFKKAIYDQYGGDALKKGVQTPLGFVPPYEYDGNTQKTFQNFFGTDSPFADIIHGYRIPKQQQCSGNKNAINSKTEEINVQQQSKDTQQDNILKAQQPHLETVIISLEELYRGCLKLLSVPMQEIDPCSDQLNVISTSKILHLRINPGLPENTVFRFPRDPNEHSTSSEIIVVTKDKPHDVFWREGVDLHMNKTVYLKQALTGFSFTVTTLDERILHIPITEVITCDSKKIVKSEGMPHVEEPHKRGDLVIHLAVEYPKFLPTDLRKHLGYLLDDVNASKNTTRQILDKKLNSKAGKLDL